MGRTLLLQARLFVLGQDQPSSPREDGVRVPCGAVALPSGPQGAIPGLVVSPVRLRGPWESQPHSSPARAEAVSFAEAAEQHLQDVGTGQGSSSQAGGMEQGHGSPIAGRVPRASGQQEGPGRSHAQGAPSSRCTPGSGERPAVQF